MTTKYKIHPLAQIFPEIEGPAFDALVKDIEANGQQSAAALYEGMILDGKNRYRACEQLGRELMVREYEHDGKDPIGFVLSINLHRRQLDTSQRSMVAASLANLKVGTNRYSKKEGPSIEVAAQLLNVGRASVERAKIVLNSGDADLIKSVQTGEKAVSEAAAEVQQTQEEEQEQGQQQQQPSTRNTGSKAQPTKTKRKGKGKSGKGSEQETVKFPKVTNASTALKAYGVFEQHLLDALQDVNEKSDFSQADELAQATIEKLQEKLGQLQPEMADAAE
jgi:hypothetical protein